MRIFLYSVLMIQFVYSNTYFVDKDGTCTKYSPETAKDFIKSDYVWMGIYNSLTRKIILKNPRLLKYLSANLFEVKSEQLGQHSIKHQVDFKDGVPLKIDSEAQNNLRGYLLFAYFEPYVLISDNDDEFEKVFDTILKENNELIYLSQKVADSDYQRPEIKDLKSKLNLEYLSDYVFIKKQMLGLWPRGGLTLPGRLARVEEESLLQDTQDNRKKRFSDACAQWNPMVAKIIDNARKEARRTQTNTAPTTPKTTQPTNLPQQKIDL